jgi:hypothetical protein
MTGAFLIFTRHAEDMLKEREIDREWVRNTIEEPDTIAPDLKRPGVLLAFRQIPERGGRVLRVAHVRSNAEVKVLTVFFDRQRTKQ